MSAPLINQNNSESPSAYLIFPTVSAGNSCTRVGEIYTSVTMSFPPGALSTIEGLNGPWKSFNFADLPCPPPDVAAADSYFYNPQVNPNRPYLPIIAPPTELWGLDPEFKNCVTAVIQGVDPESVLSKATKLSPLEPEGGLARRHPRRRAVHTHRARQPIQTPGPA